MSREAKKEIVERVTKKFILLPVDKQNYIEGFMQGYMMEKEEKKKDNETDKQPA